MSSLNANARAFFEAGETGRGLARRSGHERARVSMTRTTSPLTRSRAQIPAASRARTTR